MTEEVRPPAWRPVRYNDEFCIRRYFVGEFQSQSTLRGFLSPEFQTDYVADASDGKIVYVTAETHSELDYAEDTAHNHSDHDRVILQFRENPCRYLKLRLRCGVCPKCSLMPTLSIPILS